MNSTAKTIPATPAARGVVRPRSAAVRGRGRRSPAVVCAFIFLPPSADHWGQSHGSRTGSLEFRYTSGEPAHAGPRTRSSTERAPADQRGKPARFLSRTPLPQVVPPAGQADRLRLQPRLRLLLLPREGAAVPGRAAAHERRDCSSATSGSSSRRTARRRSTIAWQGGEPMLMGLEFFRRAVELGKKHARPGMTVQPHHPDQRHQDQRRLGAVLRGERLPRRPQHRRAARAARRLPARQGRQADVRQGDARPRGAARARRGVERAHHGQRRQRRRTPPRSTASCATTAAASSSSSSPSSSGRPRTACPYGAEVTDRSVTPEGWGQFLIGVFDEWVRRDVGEVFVQLFDVALANWYGEPSGLCVHTASCGTALAMEFNGDVYACDHFVEPEYLRGNIREQHLAELVGSPTSRCASATDKLKSAAALLPSSATCASPATAAAPRTASSRTPDGEPGLNYLCPGYKDVLPPRRRADAAHVRPAAPGARAGRHRRRVPRHGVAAAAGEPGRRQSAIASA